VFDKFVNRYIVEADLKTETAIHIGASSEEFKPSVVDNQVLKDINGKPYIPGSSLKGVLRSFLERILSTEESLKVCTVNNMCLKNVSNAEERKKISRGKTEQEFAQYIYDNICIVCKIFGGSNNGAKLMIRDAKIKSDYYFNGFEIRNGVTIDRDKNTAVEGHLYEVEVVPADTVFSFKAVADNVTEEEWKYILLLLKAMEEGIIEIGGLTSRGLGEFKLENISIERIEGKDIFKSVFGKEKNIASLEQELERVGEFYV
jgi:CRISPR-associated protein Csm3